MKKGITIASQLLILVLIAHEAQAQCPNCFVCYVDDPSDCTKAILCFFGVPAGTVPCNPRSAFFRPTQDCVRSGPVFDACFSDKMKPSILYAGKVISEDRTEVLNADDTLMIKMRATGRSVQSIADNVLVGFVITKNAPPSTISVKLSTGGTPTTLTVTGGVLVYDTVNGNAAGYDHVIVRSHLPFYDRNLAASGHLLMFIPKLTLKDAGDYYFSFMDGVGATNTEGSPSISTSYAFKLVMRTKTSSCPKNAVSGYLLVLTGSLVALLV